jgi:subtilisin-like proprotein convertase family protein
MSNLRFLILALIATLFCASTSLAQVMRTGKTEVALKAQDSRAAVLAANSNTALQFTVDSSSGSDLIDVVPSDSSVKVSLVLPNGTEVGEVNPDASGFTYAVIPEGAFRDSSFPMLFTLPGKHHLFLLPETAPTGTYQVKVNASTVNSTSAVLATYISRSPIRAGLLADAHEYRTGETVVLTGLLFNGSSPVTNATITALVADDAHPEVAPAQVLLRDSGNFDTGTGDGLYTGTFPTDHAGQFTVTIRVNGTTPAGASYSRSASTSFRVVEPLARFVSFQDAGADDNFNGLTDRVVITSALNVQRAGAYQFGITLVASNGQKVKASATSNLEQGAQQLSVSFPADQLLALGTGGPFALKDAILILQDDALGNPVADYRLSAGDTAAYQFQSLEHPPLFFTGHNTVTTLDNNGNGKYDFMRIDAEILVTYAGFYQWSGSLVDPSGHEIEFTSGGRFLNAGSNLINFNFDGGNIGRNGVSGKYALRSVLMFGAGQSTLVNKLMETQQFSYKQFEDSDAVELGAFTAMPTQGDADAYVEPGESVALTVSLKNRGNAILTGVNAKLSTTTPGVTITNDGAAYSNLSPSGSANNLAPFTFHVAQNFQCGQEIKFQLSVRDNGDGGIPSVLEFSVPVGQTQEDAISYTGLPVQIPDNNSFGVNIPLAVSGLPETINDLNFLIGGSSCSTAIGATTVGLNHTFTGDLLIRLTSPQGTTVTLINRVGDTGNNFCQTLLDDQAVNAIQEGSASAPFTGAFKPASPLAAFSGENPNGTWVLNVSDRAGADTGSVRAFSLIISGPATCDSQGGSTDSIAPTTNVVRSAAPNASGWNNTDVQLTLNAVDNQGGSGVREIAYSVSGAQTIPATTVSGSAASLTVGAEGASTVTFYSKDNAGNIEAAQTLTLNIDKTKPTITINAPSETYFLNQPVNASYSCSDSASGLATCSGTLPDGASVNTSSLGLGNFTVTATDVAGNSADASSRYAVAYNIGLLYDPAKAHQMGSTIPIKIRLTDAFGQNLSSTNVVVTALRVEKISSYAPGILEDAGNSNSDDNFRFTNFDGAGGYIFNLKTTGLTTGTYALVFKAGTDPTTHIARFQVK